MQVLGAIVCLLALVWGLGLTPSGHGSLAWELILLALGVVLLLSGSTVARRASE